MKKLTRVLSLILILTVCLIPMLLTASASAVTAYDYSKDGSYFNTEKNTADLVEIIIGEKLSEAEYNYLKEYGELSVKYEEVTSQHVRITVFDGGILVTADEYSYFGKEGKAALWTPKSATVDGVSATFEKQGDSYTATLNGVVATEETLVGVEYELTVNGGGFVFAKESVNNALNLAFNNKDRIKAEYDDAVAKKIAYDEYYAANKTEVDTYYSNLEAYNKYLLDKKLYDAKLAAYNEYLDDVAAFEAAELTYAEYLVKKGANDAVVLENYNLKQAYEAELREYNESYVKKLNVAKEQIKTLDTALYTNVTTLERQLYGAIFATLVDQVVENKDLFVSVLGADPDVIDACGTATGILRGILGEYKKLKKEKDKYEFYIQNYDSLRDNIILLTRSLENLYKSRSIRATMHDQGKTEKFVIFVAQLVLFANTLTDEDIYDYTNSYKLNKDTTMKYLVGEGVTNYVTNSMLKILEDNEYVKDTGNAKPLDTGYPVFREEPKEPEYKKLPYENLSDMQEPIAPDEVENPGNAPAVVNEPVKPQELTEKELTDEILLIAGNTVYRDIVNNYSLITERAEYSSDFTFKPTKTVTKSAISHNAVNVKFMDNDGNEIATVTVEKNDSISFMGELPIKPSDIEADYQFDHWMDSDGNEYDFTSVTESVTLYPSYKTIYKNYDQAYNVNGNPYLHVDVSGNALGTVPLEHFIDTAKGNSTGILFTADNVVVRIALTDVNKLFEAGVTTLDTAIDTSRASAYTFSFLLKNAENAIVDTSAALYVQIPSPDSDFATSSTLSYTDADGKMRGVNKDYANGFVSFKAKANVPYLMCVRRAISAMVGSGVQFEGNVTNVIPGETVTIVPTEAPAGKIIQYTYTYTDASGNSNVTVIEGNSFVMPNYAVSVGMTLIDIKYTVTFMSDGKVISSNNLYTYGQKLEKPRDPVKQNDADYSYKFIGWSPELSDTVTGDVTYVAQYEKTAIVKVEKKGPQISEKYLKLIKLAIVAVVVFVVLVAGGITLIVVLRRRKRRTAEAPETTPPTDTPPTDTPPADTPPTDTSANSETHTQGAEEHSRERVDFEKDENGGK